MDGAYGLQFPDRLFARTKTKRAWNKEFNFHTPNFAYFSGSEQWDPVVSETQPDSSSSVSESLSALVNYCESVKFKGFDSATRQVMSFCPDFITISFRITSW